ncbi:MAG: aldehyde dehydrogenase family protein, partial [Acidobacteriota bacterium]|nr:aldehyde dehydrogenase family protein [Acidobacteriota bacterium]
ALEVREVGKDWADADADVCEAVDYCEYYARRILELDLGGEVQSPPGERNRLRYRGRGVCAVVAPWNFPLAIPAGMTSAAVVAGNAVVLKPAEQSPAVAEELVSAFRAAGLPDGVLSFLPGGGDLGAALVADPAVDLVAFTGSRQVGLQVIEAAGRMDLRRRSVPRVVAEMGGKNAVVVDDDADLDEVVPAVVRSAFGFAGQKCSAASRLVAVDRIHDALVDRVVEAARSLVVGPPRHAASQVGPVVDAEAHARLLDAVGRLDEAGMPALRRDDVPASGYFVGPAVVTDVDPGSWLAQDELFGPVLAVFRVPDFAAGLRLANDSAYALTAGVFSRSQAHVHMALEELVAGNVYVNRAVTGAVVGRQPFGGNRLSGVGSKAGGPDYLLQFLDPQVTTENLVRQGFAEED